MREKIEKRTAVGSDLTTQFSSVSSLSLKPIKPFLPS